MAFDRNDPADLTALWNEVTLDPLSFGYNPDGVNDIVRKINDADLNFSLDPTATVAEKLTVALLLDVIETADFDSPQVTDGERRYIESFMGRELNEDVDRWKAKIQAAFQTNSTTSQAIDALVRNVSRAEKLWGEGTTIVKDDWFAARAANQV